MASFMPKDQLTATGRIAAQVLRGVAEGVIHRARRAAHADAGRHGLRFVLRDMRPTDPSFEAQIQSGIIRLGGQTVDVPPRGVFAVKRAGDAFHASAHSFSWLRDLRAGGTPDAFELMRLWTIEWINRGGRHAKPAKSPTVTARRIMSWLAHADILLDDVDADVYDAIIESLEIDARALARQWKSVRHPIHRLTAGLSLVAAGMALPSLFDLATDNGRLVEDLLCTVIDDNGSPISRNPTDVISILLDTMPVYAASDAHRGPLTERVSGRMAKARDFLRMMRLGDGALARFNGTCGTVRPDLGRAGLTAHRGDVDHCVQKGGYVRLEAASTILILDAGALPPPEAGDRAGAGCLSFELSSGSELVVINPGMPPADTGDAAVLVSARSTARHSTLRLTNRSSARPKSSTDLAGAPLMGLTNVDSKTRVSQQKIFVSARHNGYETEYGICHTRQLTLSADGDVLIGSDRISGDGKSVRFGQSEPFAISFHLHPSASCEPGQSRAIITLRSGERWQFASYGARLSLEESAYVAGYAGPQPCHQIVLRGATDGETTVKWKLRRIGPRPLVDLE